jgi:hypothetical protein
MQRRVRAQELKKNAAKPSPRITAAPRLAQLVSAAGEGFFARIGT